MLSRFFHTSCRRLVRRQRRANPGVSYQVHELDHVEQLEHDPEGFGNVEADFMDVHKSHRQHETEMQQERERIRLQMVKHKYFRDAKLPNLLTYAEKEQIRVLHQRDPDEWSVERLAESFPASPDVIEKILRAKWRPRSSKRIREHDEAVIKNWQQIRSGNPVTPLPPDLMQHLQKFSDRDSHYLQSIASDWPTRAELPKPRTTEFASLITSCSKYAGPDSQADLKPQMLMSGGNRNTGNTPPQPSIHGEDETFLLDQVVDKRKMRLQDLKKLKLSQPDIAYSQQTSSEATKSLEQLAIEAFGSPSGTGIIAKTPSQTLATNSHLAGSEIVGKFQSTEIVISVEDQKRFEMTRVKDRIHIPRKMWRQGATYRVEDCYYDDDGEFLYRVPGMTN